MTLGLAALVLPVTIAVGTIGGPLMSGLMVGTRTRDISAPSRLVASRTGWTLGKRRHGRRATMLPMDL